VSIRLLSDQQINRIAAGEVVERPASVLKELLENALDAGADRIEVSAEAGGRKAITVADNGRGMAPDDLLLAVERHATSKIDDDDSLEAIASLGFRGEALASIAAVSRTTITSAPADDGAARRVQISGGRVIKVEAAARPQGTTVEVRDLFFNVPARKKFLKTTTTEAAHLLDAAGRYALVREGLRLIYHHAGQTQLRVTGQEDRIARLAAVLGNETARNMTPVDRTDGPIQVSGWAGSPDHGRTRPTQLYLFVNRRPVKDRLLTRAVLEAYRPRLAAGRYPAAVIHVDLDPAAVDVNVHPAKTEVRFRRSDQVFTAVAEAVRQTLSSRRFAAPVRPQPPRPHPTPAPATPPMGGRSGPGLALAETAPTYEPPAEPVRFPAPVAPLAAETEAASEFDPARLVVVGQVHQAYILAQSPDGLVVIDQHAAHERVLFERTMDQARSGGVDAQRLLWPDTIDLSPVQADLAGRLTDDLNRFGYDVQAFGGTTFRVTAVPAPLADRDWRQALIDLLDQAEDHRPGQGLEALQKKLAESVACHGAIKAGDPMNPEEIRRLIDDLTRTRQPGHCPHGRPLFFTLGRREIEKRFQRA
jgi:DNA mismatch repair protein MutL